MWWKPFKSISQQEQTMVSLNRRIETLLQPAYRHPLTGFQSCTRKQVKVSLRMGVDHLVRQVASEHYSHGRAMHFISPCISLRIRPSCPSKRQAARRIPIAEPVWWEPRNCPGRKSPKIQSTQSTASNAKLNATSCQVPPTCETFEAT